MYVCNDPFSSMDSQHRKFDARPKQLFKTREGGAYQCPSSIWTMERIVKVSTYKEG
jgi:hypothetical protein